MSSDDSTATLIALLAVLGGTLVAVPVGTLLPLLRILLGGVWFSFTSKTGSSCCTTGVGLVCLAASGGTVPELPWDGSTASSDHTCTAWTALAELL